MDGFLGYLADIARWFGALVLAATPVRVWPRLERNFPVRSVACFAGITTTCLGFAINVVGTLTIVFASADDRTSLLVGTAATGGQVETALDVAGAAWGAMAVIYFPFFTPLGWLGTYLTISGAVRGFAAWFDDPIGDPILTGVHWAATTSSANRRQQRERSQREKLEGRDAPDVLRTGEWAGLPGIDYIVLAARRKPEWTEGAIIMTSGDWYRLGVPFDMQTPAGLRTAYPIKKWESLEAVRRGIEYTLPRLTQNKSANKS